MRAVLACHRKLPQYSIPRENSTVSIGNEGNAEVDRPRIISRDRSFPRFVQVLAEKLKRPAAQDRVAAIKDINVESVV